MWFPWLVLSIVVAVSIFVVVNSILLQSCEHKWVTIYTQKYKQNGTNFVEHIQQCEKCFDLKKIKAVMYE